ncbi:hypothetical protein SBRY_50358 [Actinacidiphila bryophytorum]|uniref:Uncharacterized protein n=1 Tax=Actinacidiphila bryophytorum TaxID=1436133 RepID=A0A9W4H4M8_9ACTN|nr:hypothetical protein SBRY_50358 [Actinacidiphila bryophytorum]
MSGPSTSRKRMGRARGTITLCTVRADRPLAKRTDGRPDTVVPLAPLQTSKGPTADGGALRRRAR